MNDVDKQARATKNNFDRVDKRFDKLEKKIESTTKEMRKEMRDIESGLRQEMNDMKDEILHEFHVVAENIHQDVAGANKDEILLIKQKQEQHERRISRVEEKVGV